MDELIDRQLLFGNPDRASPQISPDGRWVAFLAPLGGVLNVWVAPVEHPERAHALTDDRVRGIRFVQWSASSATLLFVQDLGGDENWRLFRVGPVAGSVPVALSPEGCQVRSVFLSPLVPDVVVVLINDRDPQFFDPVRIHLASGERSRLLENHEAIGFDFDFQLEVRTAVTMLADGSIEVRERNADGSFTTIAQVSVEDSMTTRVEGYDADGRIRYWVDSRERDTAVLVAESLSGLGERQVLAQDPRADISGLLFHPTTGRVQAARTTYAEAAFHIVDEDVRHHFEALDNAHPGTLDVLGRSTDDQVWIVSWTPPNGSVRFAIYQTSDGAVRQLFLARTALSGLPLTARRPVMVRARDGLTLVSYLSLPRWLDHDGRPPEPLPLVLVVHGGPWARDEPGYDATHQLLANRGYAVLSVNFRGSTGFGKQFLNAGNFEWAGRMHDDLLDAVAWAVDQGIADAAKIAILGGSYGGYAALVGLTFTPDVFACAVDIVGPSSIQTLLESVPPYWEPVKAQFHSRVGTDQTEEGRADLWSRSPLSKVHEIRKPLLIAQGANDPRVKQSESDQIVREMRQRGIPVTYALFPDEGHGFARPQNRMAFYALVESFLAEHLGGRAQPDDGATAASSVQLT